MEKLRKYYVLAVAALNFVICAIAFFIWTRIVVMATDDHIFYFSLIAAAAVFILCYLCAEFAVKKGIITSEKKKKSSLANKSTLLSLFAIAIAIAISQSLFQVSDRIKKEYIPGRYDHYSVYNVDIKRIKDKVYLLEKNRPEEPLDKFRKKYERY